MRYTVFHNAILHKFITVYSMIKGWFVDLLSNGLPSSRTSGL